MGEGILIKGPETANDSEGIQIKGEFSVKYECDGITAEGAQVLKHIAIVVTRYDNYQSFTPFKDVVVFPDDVKADKDGCSGFFNINLKDYLQFGGEGDYYIVSSLGTLVTDVIKIKVSD